MNGLVATLILVLASVSTLAVDIASPQQFLGYRVGDDRRLADWDEISRYLLRLGQSSDRLLVERVGASTEGRDFLLLLISSPHNLARLEYYRGIQEALADPRGLEDPEEMVRLGKTIVLVTCGIHATEVASPQMSLEFAWEMATGEDEETLEILENVIFLLVPSLNPDGLDIVVDWYRRTLGTPAEGTSPPQLYHPYAGHDNNRDWYMFTQRETRLAVEKIHNRWHPQIVYDLHQMGSAGARIFVPPFIDPIDPNVDPLLQAQIVDVGGFMFSALVASGRKGVLINGIYDAYTPARAYQNYHGGVRLLSESASARLATPVTVKAESLGQGRNYHAGRASWNFPEPWMGGTWRLRDIVEDQKTAVRACLTHAARNRVDWLENFYRIGVRACNRTRPHAFVIPRQQRDPEALYDLLETLQFGLVEIRAARADFRVSESSCVSPPFCQSDKGNFHAGDWIVYMQQPYSAFAKTMLEIQDYPELRVFPNGPLQKPYDVTAQTLGIQLGVETYQIDEPFDVESEKPKTIRRPSGHVSGEGHYLVYSHTNNAFARLTNRLLARGYRVDWATYGFRVNDRPFPVGTLLAHPGAEGGEDELQELLRGLPVQVERLARRPQLAWQRIREPRIGLYQSYRPAIDEGWSRWVLERNEFTFQSLHDSDIREGSLSRFDVIIFADQTPSEILKGLTEPYPKELQGGIGNQGLLNLQRFAQAGGTLLFLGRSGELVLEGWDLADMTRDHWGGEFQAPGALLRILVNNRHPVGYGMSRESAAMVLNPSAIDPGSAVSVVRYPAPPIRLSGWTSGEEWLAGKTAVFEKAVGRGGVIVMNFQPQFRAQSRVTYKLVFNSLYYATTR